VPKGILRFGRESIGNSGGSGGIRKPRKYPKFMKIERQNHRITVLFAAGLGKGEQPLAKVGAQCYNCSLKETGGRYYRTKLLRRIRNSQGFAHVGTKKRRRAPAERGLAV